MKWTRLSRVPFIYFLCFMSSTNQINRLKYFSWLTLIEAIILVMLPKVVWITNNIHTILFSEHLLRLGSISPAPTPLWYTLGLIIHILHHYRPIQFRPGEYIMLIFMLCNCFCILCNWTSIAEKKTHSILIANNDMELNKTFYQYKIIYCTQP